MRLIAAALLLAAPQVADAAATKSAKPCVSRAELVAAFLYLLPKAIPAVTDKCRPHLPDSAWLLTEGQTYAERLAAKRAEHWPGTLRMFEKVSDGPLPPEISDESIRSLTDDVLRAKLMPEIKPKDCGTIDEAARLVAPLPPENLAELVGLIAERSIKKGNPPICPAPAA